MARGYADFFGFSMFPFYGSIRHSGFIAKALPGSAETELFGITGKGRLWGGWFNVWHATNIAGQAIRIYIDGTLVCSYGAQAAIVYNYPVAPGNMLYVTYYRDVDNPVVYGLIVPDQTYGQSWSLRVSNGDVAAGGGGCNIDYTIYT